MIDFTSNHSKPNKKRGISTIVGGMIFLVLLTSGFSTFFIAMDMQYDTIDAQLSVSNLIIDKTKEKFTIAASIDKNNNNRLGIQLKNLGSNPVHVGNIWIINNSGNFPAKKYEAEYSDSIIPAGYGVDILENKPLFMTPDYYDIKVVSILGTIEKLKLEVGGSNNLRASLIAIPPEVKVGENVTMAMHVENIGNSRLLNVAPFGDYPNINPSFISPIPPVPLSWLPILSVYAGGQDLRIGVLTGSFLEHLGEDFYCLLSQAEIQESFCKHVVRVFRFG